MADDNAVVTPSSFMDRVLAWIKGSESKLSSLEAAMEKLSCTQDELKQARADLTTEKLTVANLQKQVADLQAQSKSVADREAAVAQREKDMDAEVERKANLTAGQKLAAIGVRPVSEETNTNPQSSTPKTWTERSLAYKATARN